MSESGLALHGVKGELNKGLQTGAIARDTVIAKLSEAQMETPSTIILIMSENVRSKSFPTGQPRFDGTETWPGGAPWLAETWRPGRSAAEVAIFVDMSGGSTRRKMQYRTTSLFSSRNETKLQILVFGRFCFLEALPIRLSIDLCTARGPDICIPLLLARSRSALRDTNPSGQPLYAQILH